MTETPGASKQPLRVAMMVGNDLTADTRVRKMAVGLSHAGADVTLIGLSTTGAKSETYIGDVHVVRLPVNSSLKNAATQRRTWRPKLTLGYGSKEEMVVAQRRRKVREREIAAEVGRINARLEELGDPLLDDRVHRALRIALQGRRRILRSSIKPRRKYQQLRASLYRRKSAGELGQLGDVWTQAQDVLLRVPPLSDWRRLIPVIDDYELSYGPFLDELDPDVIHAHDVHLIGIAERAVARARNRGRHIRWIYDAHEYIPGLSHPDRRVLRGYIDLEREYADRADRTITVSDPIADLMKDELSLERRPTVVLNIPVVRPSQGTTGPSVRDAAGLEDETPLLVYSGGVSAARGVMTLVESLAHMPGVHAAVVSKSTSRYVQRLEARALELGVRNRLHIVPFVDPDQVVTYLSSADVGVHTLVGGPMNHELALPNKFFEYLHARLPIVPTGLRAMGRLTRELGIGEPFQSEDAEDLARAALTVLKDRSRYTRPYSERPEILEKYTWARQELAMVRLYEDLIGQPLREGRTEAVAVTELLQEEGPAGAVATASRSLMIGPANMAGQAWSWARAIEQELPEVHVQVVTLQKKSGLAFPTDVRIPRKSWWSLEWQLTQVREVLTKHTHVLMEGGYGIFGELTGGSFATDVALLNPAGIHSGVVFHGSELRDPSIHRKLEPFSPYADAEAELSVRLQELAERTLDRLNRFEGPRFVTTLDLLDYVPEATWLPVVAPPELWVPGATPLERDRPVVVHVPSNPQLKGSAPIDVIAEELDGRGLIEYRRLSNVPVSEMPTVLADADIVLDQFALGDYGVLAAQAMATGRVVVGHVADRVRERLPEALPIVEATPQTVGDVLMEILQDRERFRAVACAAARFAATYHSGDYSARQLRTFLGYGDDQ